MAELEPGNPDELIKTLRNWLREAHDPLGSLAPGTDPVEWAIRQFIASWSGPVRSAIRETEENLDSALRLLESGDITAAKRDIEMAQQVISESIRDELGLYRWDDEVA